MFKLRFSCIYRQICVYKEKDTCIQEWWWGTSLPPWTMWSSALAPSMFYKTSAVLFQRSCLSFPMYFIWYHMIVHGRNFLCIYKTSISLSIHYWFKRCAKNFIWRIWKIITVSVFVLMNTALARVYLYIYINNFTKTLLPFLFQKSIFSPRCVITLEFLSSFCLFHFWWFFFPVPRVELWTLCFPDWCLCHLYPWLI